MSKRQWLCIIGVWVIVFLFLGIPDSWSQILAPITGLIIIVVSYNLPHEKKGKKQDATGNTSAFSENNNYPQYK